MTVSLAYMKDWLSPEDAQALRAELAAAKAEVAVRGDRLRELDAILNMPMLKPFAAAVVNEAQHQRLTRGDAHDACKSPWDWFWTLGFLSQKAAAAQLAGDLDKALHHTVSSGALLAHWHRHIEAARPAQPPPPSGEDGA